jgi:hypothetical protein
MQDAPRHIDDVQHAGPKPQAKRIAGGILRREAAIGLHRHPDDLKEITHISNMPYREPVTREQSAESLTRKRIYMCTPEERRQVSCARTINARDFNEK